MCQAKPGSRCAGDTEKDLTKAKNAYVAALTAHANDLDDASTAEKVQAAAAALWVSQLEYAAAHVSGPRPVTDDWRVNVAYDLDQAHRDQAALMPPHPGPDAPRKVKDAYRRLAEARDRLARADAIVAADEQAPLTGRPNPGPVVGPRPTTWTVESDVTQAEYDYARALHPDTDMTVGEHWRHLLNYGQVPYDPFSNATHPRASESAPWVRHSRPAAALDVPALRRATGLGDAVYWDAPTRTIAVHFDAEEMLEDDEREDYSARIEASLWQLGYHTERDGSEITIGKVPDIAGWVEATKRANTRTAAKRTKVA